MKIKKNFFRILIICIILMLFLAFKEISYGSVLGGFAIAGIETVLVVAIQELVLIIGITAGELIDGITGIADGKSDAFLAQVLFNKVESVRANFFPELLGGTPSDTMSVIINNIGGAYQIIRNLAIALLLGVLIYIGIRMAISTVASEEAKYKKMFKDWFVSLSLVFVLHFIIIGTFYVNDTLVETLYKTIGHHSGINMRTLAANAAIPIAGWPETIIYVSLVTSSLVFVLMYLKRIITLGFLIVIAPLITVTYSIDKIGDGRSQALNTWLKEFMYTVLIQPFHCIIYIIFVRTAFDLVTKNHNIESEVLAVMSVFFLLKAEGIVKKIFGIKADSMADALSTGASTLAVMTSLMKNSKKPVSKGKGKMPEMKGNVNTKDEAGGAPSSEGAPSSSSGNSSSNNGNSSGENNGASSGNNSSSTNNTSQNNSGNSGSMYSTSSSGNHDSNNEQYERNKQAAQARAKAEKEKRKKELIPPNELAEEIRNHYKRKAAANGYNGANAIIASRVGSLASGAAAVVGATMGATIKDAGTAVSTGYAMHNIASGIEGAINDRSNQKQLDENQSNFAGAYEEFANEYRKEFGSDLTDEQIWAAAEDLYEGGAANLDEGYQLDFYNQMDDLKTSAEIMGYGDGMDYVKDSMRLASEGRIIAPDDYSYKNYTYTEDELYQRDLKKVIKAEGGTNGPIYKELKELDDLIAANRGNPTAIEMYKKMREQKMEQFKNSL